MARLLVVDDSESTLEWMQAALAQAGHEVRLAQSAQRALAILDEWTPDLALIDVLMPEIDGWAFSRMVQRYGIRVLFVSLVPGEGEAILRGCTGLLRKPLTPTKLRHEVQRILGQPGERPTVLLVDDDPDIRITIAQMLTPTFLTLEAENGAAALALLESNAVALVITDVRMPVMDGRELVRRLRGDARFVRLPIIVQTADPELARARIWTELQVEQVMQKREFFTWLLSRIDFALSDRAAVAQPG